MTEVPDREELDRITTESLNKVKKQGEAFKAGLKPGTELGDAVREAQTFRKRIKP